MPHPVDVRVGLASGRPVVLAFRIDDGAEITARDLRGIRLPGIAEAVVCRVRELANDLEPAPNDLDALQRHDGPLTHTWDSLASAMLTVAEEGAMAAKLRAWLTHVADADVATLARSRKRGIGAPSDDDYAAFAKAYLEEHLERPHGAKTRLASRLNVDRVTVYRWTKAARERGLLPPENEGESS